jgi:alanine racemase
VSGSRPTRVDVDLDAIRHNVRTLKPEDAGLMAVVKADAYGHGDVAVAGAAVEAGATWIGVALVEEGLRLREAGIEAPILVLSEFPPGSEPAAITAGLTPTLYSDAALARLSEAAVGADVGVHVKVDTGMHRVGVYPPEVTTAFVDRVVSRGLRLEGLWTHYASSSEDEKTTLVQLECFLGVVADVRAAGHQPALLHTANSGATAARCTVSSRPPASPTAWGCVRRSHGARRSRWPNGFRPASGCRMGTAIDSTERRTSPPCRWATRMATLASCPPGRMS